MGYLGIPHDLASDMVLDKLQKTCNDVHVVEEIAVSLPSLNHTSSDHIGEGSSRQPDSDASVPLHLAEPNQPRGAFIYCRGGINRVGKVRTWWIEQFLRHGDFVFAPCYRGSEGSEGRDLFGGDDVEDVTSMLTILSRFPLVHPAKISVMGFSRGSVNATQAAVQFPSLRALVLWGGVSDLAQTYADRVDLRRMLRRVVGGTPRRVPEAFAARSPIELAADLTCPVLIIHGTDDVQVGVWHGKNMAEKLRALNKPVSFHQYNGQGHHLHPLVFEAIVDRMFDWIRGYH
ncbi:S9 family peptidase [Alicyclobacillus sp. SO9]|uniref:alpha/beta hydrolase family protein n=1 Tax=Alicyclobacillus sp. SO9 TaxID=2665646 RepID=UPI0018E7A3D7|nr:prolyl oligopeptidase family serine peptidase [Alicyclobacillus sp. SO9]